MDIVLSIAAVLLTVSGIVGCIVPVLPGPIIGYAGLLCIAGTGFSELTGRSLVFWLLAVAAASAADYFLPAWMTRRFGGSRAGAIGATVGAFAGFFLFPPVGIILGPFAGALVGELLDDSRDTAKALRSGMGSFLAFIVGTGIKLLVAAGMFVHVLADLFPVLHDWFATTFQTQ